MTAARPARTDAAVIVPVYRDNAGDLRLVLVLRGAHGIHGGQLALPGGRREGRDATPFDTALREAEEEIGLPRRLLKLLTSLPPVATRTTGFQISPFLVRVSEPPAQWRCQPGEIAGVVEPRVADLATHAARGQELRHFATWPEPRPTPFLWAGPHKLWGVTYRIVEPLLPRLLGGEWPI